MKRKLTVLSVVLAIVMLLSLVGCSKGNNDSWNIDSIDLNGSSSKSGASASDKDIGDVEESKSSQEVIDLSGVDGNGATVKMSVMYDTPDTRMKFMSNGNIKNYNSIVDGVYYTTGKFKPTWVELQNRLNFNIEDVTPTTATTIAGAYTTLSTTQFMTANILSGPVNSIVEDATASNAFVDLTKYLDYLPNFKNFISQNDLIHRSLLSENGAIYYAPYFDGYDDIETMFILRKDWVEKLLDTDEDVLMSGLNEDTTKLTAYYSPYYKTMNTTVTVANKEGTGTKTVTIAYDDGGAIAKQNASDKTGKGLTKALRDYIDQVYMGKGVFEKRSDLFCGQDACYNADEMIALMRCVKTAPKYLSGMGEVFPFYPRSDKANRTAAVIQLCQLWGVRGYDSRSGYLYLSKDGRLMDARTSPDMMEALEFINQLYNEQLIVKNYTSDASTSTEYRDRFNMSNQGFLTYDYNQTTTVYNDTAGIPGMNLTPILFPVADWDNKAVKGEDGYSVTGENTLYQYTESWRSVKTEGWCINYSLAKQNPKVFKKCLEIFDYMYTKEGQTLMTFGPEKWIEHDAQGNMVTIDYHGRKVPKISANALAELRDPYKGAGNYTNYYRFYVGATLPLGFVKEQGMEYQSVDGVVYNENGELEELSGGGLGLSYINKAADLGTLKHATVNRGADGNIQNSLVPTTFPLSSAQNKSINDACKTLNANFDNSSAAGKNVFHDYIIYGFGNTPYKTVSKDQLVETIQTEWNLAEYMRIYRSVYEKMYS